jgi:hypothetical protein
MDETTIEDAELEDALEKRQVEKSALSEQRKAYKEANEATKVGIAKLELPDGHAVRIGRFRITRTAIPGRHVDFDVDPRSQVSIAFLGD